MYHRAVICRFSVVRRQRPRSRMNSMASAMTWSAAKKKIDAMTAKTTTIATEIIVSRREGHVTFAVSDLTCWRKVKGLVVFDAICRSAFNGPA